MKKTLLILLCLAIVLSIFASCNNDEIAASSEVSEVSAESEFETSEPSSEEAVVSDESEPETSEPSPKEYYDNYDGLSEFPVFGFEAVEELQAHLERDGGYITAHPGTSLVTEEYDTLVQRINTENVRLIAPVIDDSKIKFQNKEGFSNITLFTSELYGRPWIWYHCTYNSQEFKICVMYLTESELTESKGLTASEYLAEYFPDTANINNAEKQTDFERIYEDTLQLDKMTFTTLNLVTGDPDYDFNYTVFIYGNTLIKVRGRGETIPQEFWDDLSFYCIE